jgi:hypothetical protein
MVVRNRLDYQKVNMEEQQAPGNIRRRGKRGWAKFPWEVTQRLESGFDLSLLDDSDETLQRLFRNDVTLFDDVVRHKRPRLDGGPDPVRPGEVVSGVLHWCTACLMAACCSSRHSACRVPWPLVADCASSRSS